jgi:hypothetical protein
MTTQSIMNALIGIKNAKLTEMGILESQTLTPVELDEMTDALAKGLETVNPTTTYPPTGR